MFATKLALALALCLASFAASAEPVRPFRPAEGVTAWRAQAAGHLRLAVDAHAARSLDEPGLLLEIPLPAGRSGQFVTHSVERSPAGPFVARASAADGSGSLVLSVAGGAVAGHVELPEAGRFTIAPDGLGHVSLTPTRSNQEGFCGTPNLVPPSDSPPESNLLSASASGTVPQIDLLVLYTQAALQGAGDEAGLRAQVQYFMSELHRAFDRSQVRVEVNVVGYRPADYQESGDPIADVNQMPSFAAAARADFKADFVLMLIERADDAVVGVAIGIPGANGNANLGYTVFRRPASDGLVVSHELGHLFGCAHDRRTDPFSASAFPYSRGHRFEADGVTYITLMSYRPGLRIHNFSNPDVLFRGVPTGVPEGRTDSAHNARTINLLAPRVALYQQAASRIEFAGDSFRVPENAGTAEVPLRRTGDLSATASLRVSAIPGTAGQGTHFTFAPQIISFASGEGAKAIQLQLLDNARADGPRWLELNLSQASATVGLGATSSARVVIDDDEPLFAFAQTNLTLREGRATNLTIRRHDPSASARSISFEISGTAGASDFLITPARLDFLPGESEKSISLEAVADGLAEPDEQLILRLQTDSSLEAGGPLAAAVILLRDSDRPGRFDEAYQVPIPAGLADGHVRRLLPAADGGLFCAGSFSRVSDRAFSGLLKLSADGAIDTRFAAPRFTVAAELEAGFEYGTITAIARQADGKLLLGGTFAGVEGRPANNLVRLNSDGAIDDTFAIGAGFDGEVSHLALQADGKILVAGGFSRVQGTERDMLARLQPDGLIDTTFNARLGPRGYGAVCVASLPSGEVLVGGYFETVAGVSRPSFARLSATGQLDWTFTHSIHSGVVSHILVLPDSRFYLAGNFREPNPQIARFLPDGRWDTSFRAAAFPADVLDILPFPDGRLLVAGAFVQTGTDTRNALALLLENGAPDPLFDAGLGPQSFVRRLAPTAAGEIYLAGTIRASVESPWQRVGRLLGLPVRPRLFTPPAPSSPVTVATVPGLSHVLEASPNLTDWTPLATNRAETPTTAFPGNLPPPPSFFRLRLAPPQ